MYIISRGYIEIYERIIYYNGVWALFIMCSSDRRTIMQMHPSFKSQATRRRLRGSSEKDSNETNVKGYIVGICPIVG